MSIKNPFALRDGIIISIDDLDESERGLACNCVCPHCGDKFQARMGNIRSIILPTTVKDVMKKSHSSRACI